MMRPLNILVVDDGTATDAVVVQLRRLGHRVRVASSSAEALAVLGRPGEDPFDLILCDDLPPTIDGLSFLLHVGERPNAPQTALMSRTPDRSRVLKALRFGACDFLARPIHPRDLTRALERITVEDGPSASVSMSGELLGSERRAELIEYVESLRFRFPVTPAAVSRVASLSAEAEPDPDRVFGLLESDSALANAVFAATRAVQFHGRAEPASVREAAMRLGSKRALGVALTTIHNRNYEAPDRRLKRVVAELWVSHYVSSLVAENLAQKLGWDDASAFQTMVLFMELGELAVLRAAIDLWPEMLASGRPDEELESINRATHAELGALLLRSWNMPRPFIQLAAWHDAAELAHDGTHRKLNERIAVARLARHLAAGALPKSTFGARHPPGARVEALREKLGQDALNEAAASGIRRARTVLT